MKIVLEQIMLLASQWPCVQIGQGRCAVSCLLLLLDRNTTGECDTITSHGQLHFYLIHRQFVSQNMDFNPVSTKFSTPEPPPCCDPPFITFCSTKLAAFPSIALWPELPPELPPPRNSLAKPARPPPAPPWFPPCWPWFPLLP